MTEWVQGTRLDLDASPDVPRLCGVAVNAYLTMLLDTGVRPRHRHRHSSSSTKEYTIPYDTRVPFHFLSISHSISSFFLQIHRFCIVILTREIYYERPMEDCVFWIGE